MVLHSVSTFCDISHDLITRPFLRPVLLVQLCVADVGAHFWPCNRFPVLPCSEMIIFHSCEYSSECKLLSGGRSHTYAPVYPNYLIDYHGLTISADRCLTTAVICMCMHVVHECIAQPFILAGSTILGCMTRQFVSECLFTIYFVSICPIISTCCAAATFCTY